MKITEIRELTENEIIEKLEGERLHLNKLKINHAVTPLDNPIEIKKCRKTIARLKTEQRYRELKKEKNGE